MFTYKCLNLINICNTFIVKQLSHSSLFSKMIFMPFVVLGKNLKQKNMCDKTILCCFWWWVSLYEILLSLLSVKYHNYVRYYPRLENYNNFYTPGIKKTYSRVLLAQALVSFKKCMLPPLPCFKVNICPLPTPYNRLSGQQMLSGTQIISTSHGMTGRNFFDVFLPFYLLFGF